MSLEDIVGRVVELPEVAAWPEMARLFEQSVSRLSIKWELPLLACRAVGGKESDALAGAASVACMQLSLVLVDDMLDRDPRGTHIRLGSGAAANLAFAFQAAAFCLIEQAPVEPERRAAVYAGLARMALVSSFGQELDARNLDGEEAYWRVVRAKSAPFFGTALHVGGLLGQATPEVVQSLYAFGLLFGEMIQIYDDLVDALQSPAGPDWLQGRNNLAILYARTADHAGRARFEELYAQVGDDPQALEEAQQVLVRSGAVSYCVYHLIERYRDAERLLEGVPLADPAPLRELLARQREPVAALLERVGSDIPPELGS